MEREEADNQLAKAIRDHSEAYGSGSDDHLLNSYAVIACWQSADSGEYFYSVHFDRPELPPHESKGLFEEGIKRIDIRDGEERDDD